MRVTLTCPHARYGDGMKINCTKAGARCGNQYYKQCKGWWVLNDRAGDCPLRKEVERDER